MANPPRRIPTPASAARNPFADWAPSLSSDGGATKHYEVPPELIEIARTRDQGSAAGTLTPLVPPPTPEMTAAVSAYTAPCSGLRTRTDAGVQALARRLPVARAADGAPPDKAHSLRRTGLISMGLALLALLAYHAPTLLARL